jgi:FkbM family methyltransferase
MKTISYAQNWEDILLNRVFADCSNGFYVDVGACHPIFHSVTKLFYERGWRGINIEPIPAVFETLARDRVRDVNLAVGLSNREGTMKFYECPAAVGYSTFSPEQEESLRGAGYEFVEHTIPVTTLARVCEQHVGATIDFLKIDAESH